MRNNNNNNKNEINEASYPSIPMHLIIYFLTESWTYMDSKMKWERKEREDSGNKVEEKDNCVGPIKGGRIDLKFIITFLWAGRTKFSNSILVLAKMNIKFNFV